MLRLRACLSCFAVVILFFLTGLAYAGHFTVDNLGSEDDSQPYTDGDGTNTLKKCLRLCGKVPEENLIDFSVSGTISGDFNLGFDDTGGETVGVNVTLDACSQWQGLWPGGQPGVTIDGTVAFATWLSECGIRGLFVKAGIRIDVGGVTIGGTGPRQRNVIPNGISIYSGGNNISGNYIGTDATGTVPAGNASDGISSMYGGGSNIIKGNIIAGNGGNGIYISGGDSNIIEGNVISGNGGNGILLDHSSGNKISGNYIGLDATGTAKMGNKEDGISIGCESNSNIIEGNVISGNGGSGIYLHCKPSYPEYPSSIDNKISGNYIGTDVTGTVALGNGSGITIGGLASALIGGTTAGERNVISGNGVGISCIRESDNIGGGETWCGTIIGNYIGTDATGTAKLGNGTGISVSDIYGGPAIGGTGEGEGNVISGNNGDGISLYCGSYPMQCGVNAAIFGNYIGTDATKTINLGNGGSGISLGEEGLFGTIGGNVITNNACGIAFDVGAYIMYLENGLPEISGNSIYQNVNEDICIPCVEYYEVPAPIITACRLEGSSLMLDGNTCCFEFTVEFFKHTDMTYLGSLPVGEYENFFGSIDVSGKGLSVGDYVVAKASNQIDFYCYFSDFSEPALVSSPSAQCCKLERVWNLVSFSVNKCFYEGEEPAGQPSCVEMVNVKDLGYNSLAEWFSSIIVPGDGWQMVIGMNGAMDRGLPSVFHSLNYMSPSSGYWVKVNEDSMTPYLCIEDLPFNSGCSIPLLEGWNLVGCPIGVGYHDYPETYDHPDVLGVTTWIKVDPPVAEHVFESISGKYSMVIGGNGAYDPGLSPEFSSLRYIAPCQAFWIKMTEPADLTYPEEEQEN